MSGSVGSGGLGKILTAGIISAPGVNSGGLIGPSQKPKTPAITSPNTTPPLVPNANSDSVNQAKLKSLFALQNRSGRASTLLTTATTDKFGG